MSVPHHRPFSPLRPFAAARPKDRVADFPDLRTNDPNELKWPKVVASKLRGEQQQSVLSAGNAIRLIHAIGDHAAIRLTARHWFPMADKPTTHCPLSRI
jgi:hypothetical protein